MWGEVGSGTYPCFLEEGLPGRLARGVTLLTQEPHVDKGRGREHDGLVKEQTRLSVQSLTTIDNVEEVVEVHERHIWMHILNVGTDQGVLQRDAGQGQGALCVEKLDILGVNLARQGTDKVRQLGTWIGLLERVEEVGCAVIVEEVGLTEKVGPRGTR